MPSPLLRVAADASLAGVAIVWGATFPLAKMVLRHLPPFQYLGLRFLLATVLLVPLAWRDLRTFRVASVGWGVLTGAVLFCAFALQALGLRVTTASEAGVITGLNVVIVPILASIFLRRPPARLAAVGVVTAACGLWLLAWQGARIQAGDLLVLGCAVGFAVHIVLVARQAAVLPPFGFTALQIGTVAVLGSAAGLLEPGPAAPSLAVAVVIAFMAVGATVMAYLAQTWAQRFALPTRVGLLFAIEPVAALAFGAVWLGDRLSLRQAVGAAAILAGVVMGEAARQDG